MELTVCSQDTHLELMEYQPRGQEADLWGFLVNLKWRGFGTMWGPPTDADTAEHATRVAAVEDLKRQLANVKPQFRCTTKCCVINMGNQRNKKEVQSYNNWTQKKRTMACICEEKRTMIAMISMLPYKDKV